MRESWGLRAPHLFVSDWLPFDPSLGRHRDLGGSPTLVSYGIDSFEDEGIGSLSQPERRELERAARLALRGREGSRFSVNYLSESGTSPSWRFVLCDQQGRETVVTIPCELPSG